MLLQELLTLKMPVQRRPTTLMHLFVIVFGFSSVFADASIEMEASPIKHCGTDYKLANGYVHYDGQEKTAGDQVSVSCMKGYTLEGSAFTTCLANGSWNRSTTCRIKDCGSTFNLTHGRVDFSGRTTTYNQIVPLTCDEGYQIKGSHYLTCLEDGAWSTDSSCVKMDCGTKYTVDNGAINFGDTTVGSKAAVDCDPGYKVVGDKYISCGLDGTWSKFTKCAAIDCGTEYSIANGYVDFTKGLTTYKNTASVTCHEGYDIRGPREVVCLENGTWSHTFCQIKDCGEKYDIANGNAMFAGQDTTFNHKVPLTCLEGFDLVGEQFITCGSDGKWKADTTCQIKDCGQNVTVPNGFVNAVGVATTFHEKLPVSCNEGYVLEGDPEIICQANGEWSDESYCVEKDCGSVYSIAHAQIDFSGKTTNKNHASVRCNVGFELKGPGYITCLSDGQWSSNSSCQIKICPSNYTIKNGKVNFRDRPVAYMETVGVTCDLGYEVQGYGFITCLGNRTWSKDAKCVIKDCGNKYSIAHAHIDFNGTTTYGSKSQVKCQDGFDILGPKYITCLPDGTWSRNTACYVRTCHSNYSVLNGHVRYTDRRIIYNETVPVVCDSGYEVQGKGFARCLANGSLSNDTWCRIKDCGSDYHLDNGVVRFEGEKTCVNSTIPVACDIGYSILGNETIKCGMDGIWSKTSKCILIDCGTEFALDNGYVNFTGRETTYNKSVEVTCDKGYDNDGTNEIVCLQTGQWSDAMCRIKDCGNDYDIAHGNADFSEQATTFNSKVPVTCYKGFDIIGVDHITCQADGNWSQDSSCQIKDCGDNLTIPNGVINFDGTATTYNEKVFVQCDEGYELIGVAEITCNTNGRWNVEGFCAVIDCGSKISIANAYIDFSGPTTYNNTVPVICNDGYDITGPSYLACLADGTWRQDTSCHIKRCLSNYTISNGRVNFPKPTVAFGNTVSIECNTGYEVQGNGYITCLADGTWSNDASCSIRDCGNRYTVDHGHVKFKGQDTTYKNSASISCDAGYTLQGDSEVTCLADGSWSQFSRCVINNCGTTYQLEFGYADFAQGKTTFGEKVPVKCAPGYFLKGDSYITCQADGSWSSNSVCAIKDCGTVYKLDHGSVDFSDRDTTYGQSVSVKCEIGYGLQGDSFITCKADGTWSDGPSCVLKSCKNDARIENADIQYEGNVTLFKHSVPVSCNTGFELEGDNFTTCLDDGLWSSNTVCTIKDCGEKYSLQNGDINYNNNHTTYNATASVSCKDGFEIQGENFVTCQADGTWSQASCVKSVPSALPFVFASLAIACLVISIGAVMVLKRRRKLCFAGKYAPVL